MSQTQAMERRGSALGWLSVGLGLAHMAAPRQIARLLGLRARDGSAERTLRLVGLREVTCGLGLLTMSSPGPWAWARVAGDAMDLALLGSALRTGAHRERALGAAVSVAGIACLDARMAVQSTRRLRAEGISVSRGITINRSPDEVYAFLRDLENLPRFMSHLESVRVSNGGSHWVARGPLGALVEWDAEIIEDRPAQLMVWRSVAEADVPNQGRVEFRAAPGDRGTELRVDLRYDPPAGRVGAAVAKLFRAEPGQEIASDLRRLKQVLETGEVLRVPS